MRRIKPTRRFFLYLSGVFGIFIVGFFIGNAVRLGDVFSPSEYRLGSGIFTNPLLECEVADGIINNELSSFKPVIQNYLDKKFAEGVLSHASVYYRDLNNGFWFGIKEKKVFTPASLLKLPLMITYFKEAETDSSILHKKLKLVKKVDTGLTPAFPPSLEIEAGREYSVFDLVTRMIVESDNQAAILLSEHVNRDLYSSLFQKFGFLEEEVRRNNFDISVRDYARFFRILYNASFLSQKNSELTLSILSEVKFGDGLVAGVPSDVPVAHKFGERGNPDGDDYQIHDCGIVYYPSHPYVLCVMTRGKDDDAQVRIIRDISALTYQEIDRQVLR